ncbi:MAG: helix-turn-helix domain-containing protein [bacterium]|nr:helix-turn-helix domain-containing protein [bacterium]
MKELGEYLKDVRINNGVSLEEAAEDNELSASQLENIENGNIKAFKDVYKLKEYMKNYAKYLGLDPNEVADEFNEFLFEHTSKISLDDILEAKKRIEEKEEKKIQSPYTKEYKEKFNYRPLIYTVGIIAIIIILGYLIFTLLNKKPVHNEVLRGINKEDVYEFAY